MNKSLEQLAKETNEEIMRLLQETGAKIEPCSEGNLPGDSHFSADSLRTPSVVEAIEKKLKRSS